MAEIEEPFGPLLPDNVTAEEYALSFDILHRFAGVNLDQAALNNLGDLSRLLEKVGESLHRLIIGGGRIEEVDFIITHPEKGKQNARRRSWIIRELLRNGKTIYAFAPSDHSYIDRCEDPDNESSYEYAVTISTGPITSAHAVDWRRGEVNYDPLKFPNDPSTQRGYAKVLQEGIRDVLSVVRKPTRELPEI